MRPLDRTGTGSHQAAEAGHRLDYKLVISMNPRAGTTFVGLYLPGEIEPDTVAFGRDTHATVREAVDRALAKRGIVP